MRNRKVDMTEKTYCGISELLAATAISACLFPLFYTSASAEEMTFSVKSHQAQSLDTLDADMTGIKIYQYSKSTKDEIKRSQGGFYSIDVKSKDSKLSSSEEIQIEINGTLNGTHANRMVRIIRSDNPFSASICQNRTFYLPYSADEQDSKATKLTVSRALRQLDNTSNCSTQDLVVSFFKNAYDRDKIDPSVYWSQKECQSLSLRYNYARALHQGCLILNYKDDCDLASSEFRSIQDEISENGDLLQCLKVSKQSPEDAILNIQSHQKQIEYAEVPYLFKNGEYNSAAKAAEYLLENYDKNPEMYRRVNINKNRLLMDAGVSYLLLGESYERQPDITTSTLNQACAFFSKSLSKLSQVTKPDSQTISNIEKVKSKSRKCQKAGEPE